MNKRTKNALLICGGLVAILILLKSSGGFFDNVKDIFKKIGGFFMGLIDDIKNLFSRLKFNWKNNTNTSFGTSTNIQQGAEVEENKKGKIVTVIGVGEREDFTGF